jgi:hypothetical protein
MMKKKPNDRLAIWKRDPIAFISEVLVNPETSQPFEIYPAQDIFLRESLTPTDEGRLPYPELVFSAPKKSGKTATAAMAMLYVIVALGGPYAEGYLIANDFEQASSRIYRAIARIVEASPLLRDSAKSPPAGLSLHRRARASQRLHRNTPARRSQSDNDRGRRDLGVHE